MSRDQSIRTCLWFEAGAEEAARFYVSLFEGAEVTHIFPMRGDPEGRAFLVHWTMLGQKFSAMNGGPGFPHSAATSIEVVVTLAVFRTVAGSEVTEMTRTGMVTRICSLGEIVLSWQLTVVPPTVPLHDRVGSATPATTENVGAPERRILAGRLSVKTTPCASFSPVPVLALTRTRYSNTSRRPAVAGTEVFDTT